MSCSGKATNRTIFQACRSHPFHFKTICLGWSVTISVWLPARARKPCRTALQTTQKEHVEPDFASLRVERGNALLDGVDVSQRSCKRWSYAHRKSGRLERNTGALTACLGNLVEDEHDALKGSDGRIEKSPEDWGITRTWSIFSFSCFDLQFLTWLTWTQLDLTAAAMLSLKKKYRSIKSSLNSPSSSTGGSLNDLENRVVMLCEEFPVEQSGLDSGQGSQNHRARSSQGSWSQGGTSESERPVIHLSRDRLSYRKACYVETEPNPAHKGFSQKVVQVYGNLSSFHPKMNDYKSSFCCAGFTLHSTSTECLCFCICLSKTYV